MFRIRNFHYLIQSRSDFPDFWMSLVIFSMGFYQLLFHNYYNSLRPLADKEVINAINMNIVIFYYMFSGCIGIIRVLLPFKLNIYLTILIKCNILFCFIYESTMYIFLVPIPLISITYGVLTLACFHSILILKK